jgi:putative transposase
MNKTAHSVRRMCKILKISRATVHRREKYTVPESKIFKAKVINAIMQIWLDSKKRYGAPKIKHLLKVQYNYVVTIKTVSNYMREIKIQSVRFRKFNPSKVNKDKMNRKNLLHKCKITTVNTHILTDMTYIYTPADGWVYFLSFMDVVTRKILKWALSKKMDSEFVDTLLIELINEYPKIVMIHSDQGSQYTSNSYCNILKNNKIKSSYSRKGYPYHNAWIESFHSSLKREQIYTMVLVNISDVESACFEYIEGFYNSKRIHESLGYKTPNEFEKELLAKKILTIDNNKSNGFLTYNGELAEFAI